MMKETMMSRSVRAICMGGLALSMHTAFAQEVADAPLTKVEVTGSRLASPNAESPSPLQVITAAEIAASGVTNVQDLLLKNPTMGTPTYSRTNTNFLTAGAGVATVDLRNLGTSRTLVLVNGRRYVSGVPGDSAVDLNTIPTAFIERIEILTGGSSSTYGSDAVAGVVNIILKRNFEGVAVDAQGGVSEKGDNRGKKLDLTFGTTSSDGRSNVMGHLGYSKEGLVASKDRAISAVDQISTGYQFTGEAGDMFTPTRPFYSATAPQGRFFTSGGGSFTYDKNGNVIPWNANGSATQAATGFNRSEYRSIAVPTERFLMAVSGNLALSENHSAFFEGTYASTKASSLIEPFPLASTNIFPDSGKVPAGAIVNGAVVKNPLVPQYLYDRITDTDGDGIRDYTFTRRLSEVGNRTSSVDRDTFRLATGLRGSIKDWTYDSYISYGSNKEQQTSNGQVNVLNFRNALNAIPGADGTAVCADAIAVTQGCVPINVFGYNSISPEALKYVTAPGSLLTSTTQTLAGGSISGEPYMLPAGPLGIAAGFEWRQEKSESTPDALTQAGLNAGNATPPTKGAFTVKEIFIETRVPILKDQPFAKTLTFIGAGRKGDYSTVGSTTSWNGGLEWALNQDVKFRATRALSTRAPNINELYSPPSQDFPSVTDPCVGVTATSTTPTSAGCRAAPGVNANIAANGGVFTLNQSDTQGVSGYNRGNSQLKAEQGWSSTLGVVITPRSIPVLSKFTFTADYFKIKISDAIVSTPRDYALQSCYDGSNPSLCSFITRRPTAVGANSAGSLSYVDSAVSNSGGLATEGIDVTGSWADRVGPGRLSARLAWTYVKEAYSIPLPGADKDTSNGEIGSPKNKGNLFLGYNWGDFGISSTTTFFGVSALDDQFLASYDLPARSVKVGSRTYNDFQATYKLRKQVEFYAGVNNAFGTKPPAIISGLPGNVTGTETDAGTYDAIGRRYYVGVRLSM